ncbi:hypothetical protein CALVIDRAFT_536195 [Calocera viscosa TUFC12733]|uniref:Uncharacterized protein n=1 Tax=Calocera viscosa (strain TUFC12733) TaxID=1330018 RepID=A0A167NE28_CALVF|nr:hypothetical protein CALVIDRAFT_536195 [Calocera viscosa TUFC12733]
MVASGIKSFAGGGGKTCCDWSRGVPALGVSLTESSAPHTQRTHCKQELETS